MSIEGLRRWVEMGERPDSDPVTITVGELRTLLAQNGPSGGDRSGSGGTDELIAMELTPGPELDKEISEIVFGCVYVTDKAQRLIREGRFKPSTDLNDAYEAGRACGFGVHGYRLSFTDGIVLIYKKYTDTDEHPVCGGKTPSLAICAAIKKIVER